MKRMNYMNRNEFTGNDPFTEKVIGLAIQVHRELGAGFLESVYHKAMLFELEEAQVPFETNVPLEVLYLYKGRLAENFFADVIVAGKLLLELKSVDYIQQIHEVQVVNYLKATGLDLGLILNFGSSTLQVKRKHRIRSLPPADLHLQEV
jgi:GxxExxY protein